MLSETLSKTILFAGHYGSGKTNMALALAIELKKAGRDVTVIDRNKHSIKNARVNLQARKTSGMHTSRATFEKRKLKPYIL